MDKSLSRPLVDGNVYENTSYTVCCFTERTHNSQTIFIIIIFHFSDRVNTLTCFHFLTLIFLLQCTHCRNLFCTYCLPAKISKISFCESYINKIIIFIIALPYRILRRIFRTLPQCMQPLFNDLFINYSRALHTVLQ